MRSIILAAVAALSFCASDALAAPSPTSSGYCPDLSCGRSEPARNIRVSKTATQKSVRSRHAVRHPHPDRAKVVRAIYEARVVEHPHGCPSYSFCGCGASVKVFGHSIRELWLASNWFRFPKADPAPGMVAVRPGHIFVILEVVRRGVVLAWDANSGGHRTRIHLRQLAGFSVRDPHAGRLAMAR